MGVRGPSGRFRFRFRTETGEASHAKADFDYRRGPGSRRSPDGADPTPNYAAAVPANRSDHEAAAWAAGRARRGGDRQPILRQGGPQDGADSGRRNAD